MGERWQKEWDENEQYAYIQFNRIFICCMKIVLRRTNFKVTKEKLFSQKI